MLGGVSQTALIRLLSRGTGVVTNSVSPQKPRFQARLQTETLVKQRVNTQLAHLSSLHIFTHCLDCVDMVCGSVGTQSYVYIQFGTTPVCKYSTTGVR